MAFTEQCPIHYKYPFNEYQSEWGPVAQYMYDSGLTLERVEEKPVHLGTDGTVAIGSRELIPLLTGNCWSVISSWLPFAHLTPILKVILQLCKSHQHTC